MRAPTWIRQQGLLICAHAQDKQMGPEWEDCGLTLSQTETARKRGGEYSKHPNYHGETINRSVITCPLERGNEALHI
jgi:hypothetical protein